METVNYGCNKFYDKGPQEAKYARVLVPEKPLILVDKVSYIPRREAPERWSSRVDSGLTCKYQTRLDRFSFSLFVSDKEKKFYNNGYRCECHKNGFSLSLTLWQNKLMCL
jgi:hypothetical protein